MLNCDKMDSPETLDPFQTELSAERRRVRNQTARMVLLGFISTFVLARTIVLLIMTHHIPSLYLHHGGTHVHHLNYGIFLLSIVGAITLFMRPERRALTATAVAYGVGLALTFDEFGMWLHLGGPYWQRASFDAMVLITALLGLYCAAPSRNRFRRQHWAAVVIMALALSAFGYVFKLSLKHAEDKLSPYFQQIEMAGPE